ncbi:2-oxoadipate dioxygenase/decarboxylase HglS [Novosphingobium sp. Leaf2]|uniref:2-oxoadipate dioxygenase/decarboxylase HglS n=1 Tax=Novosphingobium sp. Leaf2 TaxID=1735670 RepID=UPI0006F86857|nr:VOC family protein [Novosphingobium sp. Leaf2]KQM22351.1 hypothetical protein ASE49_02740 [Novosphingobium sp. Leaf2]
MAVMLSPDAIRSRFSAAMSAMYREEVPLYGDLIAIVTRVNAATLAADPALAARLDADGETGRLGQERHGAVRVGTAHELATLARVFAVMGMEPVGYYDLAAAGIPVHSTAFRPITQAGLAACPFRVFTSLLRSELITDTALRAQAQQILAGRHIASEACLALVAKAEAEGGLVEADADAFVAQALDIFRWHGDAIVDAATYTRLLAAHGLIADIVSFHGPHINHLTPRTLDIDAAQDAMRAAGIAVKDVIEGPPARAVPILLRQTSFHALAETFRPVDAQGHGGHGAPKHTARFGEIEQRGAALTPKGRALYDQCLENAKTSGMAEAFSAFPDDFETMRAQGLIYARYVWTGVSSSDAPVSADDAVKRGLLQASPITYEDFLPVSAAGIFRSNLAGGPADTYKNSSSQAAFESALGRPVHDPFTLYQAIEDASQEQAMAECRPTLDPVTR